MAAKSIQRILIANRGEIACRLIQAAQELGKEAVAVYSDADAGARHTRLANRAYRIGGQAPRDSYLLVEKLIAAAKATGCDAIHPGYGFLSERADAAEAFIRAGLRWIGPSPDSIAQLGNKIAAKQLLDSAKTPTLPWCVANPEDPSRLGELANKIGFPILLKAAAGGGGKGMRLVRDPKDLVEAARAASREGLAAFGDGAIFMERFLENPRHIEVQLLGDEHGNVMHLGERDCSSQRRHQKVIEEAPSHLSKFAADSICQAAVSLAKSVGYANAGTAEFLVDDRENFFFLEMNSRLQVEHSVTELVWGVDLVHAQIRVAEGETLAQIFGDFSSERRRGHAIQLRIYAEDPAQRFMPSPGKLTQMEWPSGPGIRIDTGVGEGSEISMDYDPMIAKISVWGTDRNQAVARALWALRNTVVFGVTTNINYLQDILENPVFRNHKMHVKYLEGDFGPWQDPVPAELEAQKAQIAAKAKTAQASADSRAAKGYASPWSGVR